MVVPVETGVHGAGDQVRQCTDRRDAGADPGIAARVRDRDRPGQHLVLEKADHVLRRLAVLRQVEAHQAPALVVGHPAMQALGFKLLQEGLQTFHDLRAERGELFAVPGERVLI